MKFKSYAIVVLDLRLDKPLDYGIPDEMASILKTGMRVEVPIKSSLQKGFVIGVKEHSNFNSVKPLSRILSNDTLISEDLFKLALWMSKYYCCRLGDIFKILIPPSIRKSMKPKEQLFVMRAKTREMIQSHCKEIRNRFSAQASILDEMLKAEKGVFLSELLEATKSSRSSVDALVKKGFLTLDNVRIDRSPLVNEEYFQTKHKALNSDQAEALNKIERSLDANHFETHLLYGITGSGKTEVYLQAIDKALKMDKGALMLVPEISLTAQTIERFRSRFKEKIAILHHRLSEGERNDEWHHIRTGKAKIVIGARSAVFSPIVNLGLIIVDEEHEPSYKQSEHNPCYQGRDVAVMRGKITSCTVILGSATPSLESYHNAIKGKYTLSKLHNRANEATLPKVHLVDMKKEFEKKKGFTNFSDTLLNALVKRAKSGEQSILFLNRRGYHTTMQCPECQQSIKCAHCDVSLTFHLGENRLACHLCGYCLSPPPKQCPTCKADKPLKFRGVGTELVEKSLHAVLPDIRTLRIDADTTRHKGSHQKLLREFGTGKADVLIGTQMIAKGLHFPQVTLVGVLNADASLNVPDFRASETTFQLITQVAGRSGRGVAQGEVIIQTAMPENSTILHAAAQDYEGFFKEEIVAREQFNFPPFTHIAKITFAGKNEKQVVHIGERVRELLVLNLPKEYEVAPLIPAGHVKVKDNFRYQFLVRAPMLQHLQGALTRSLEASPLPSAVRMSIDIDPSSTFF